MKVWGVLATILLIFSLCLNVWYYSETTNLNAYTSSQLGYTSYSEYELPPETMTHLRSNISGLVAQNQQLRVDRERLQQQVSLLKEENRQYEAQLLQIKEEAERAQRMGIFSSLLTLILSLF